MNGRTFRNTEDENNFKNMHISLNIKSKSCLQAAVDENNGDYIFNKFTSAYKSFLVKHNYFLKTLIVFGFNKPYT